MTLPAHVAALGPVLDFLRKAARLCLELPAALPLVFAEFRLVATVRSLISRPRASGTRRDGAGRLAPCDLPRRRVRHGFRRLAGVCRGGIRAEPPAVPVPATGRPFRTGDAGQLAYTSRVRAMGVYGSVRSGGGGRPHLLAGPFSYSSRVRAMGVYGGVRSGEGGGRPNLLSLTLPRAGGRGLKVKGVLPLLALALLGGCGGGAEEGSEIPSPTARRGRLTLPGIDRIPLARVARSNAEMRFMWAATDHYSEANGSREHGRLIRRTSCRAYIVECDDPDATRSRPFTYLQNYTRTGAYAEIDYAEAGLAPRSRHANAWFRRAIDNAGIRLASVSVRPEGYGLVGQYGDGLDFLVVHSAGNDESDAFPVRPDDPLFRGIERAAAADKVVYVAGYGVDAGGDIVRHPHSSGCDAVSDACVWAPFVTPGVGAGTSFGTARVAAALASVLAVFPRTTHQNLARMLKASARRVSTLPNGLGVVDFTRLTTLDAGGDWRLVQDGGEFNRAVAPLHLNHVTLPGNAAISSSFAVSPQGERITLGTVVAGTFGRTAPVVSADFPRCGAGRGGGPGKGAVAAPVATARRPVRRGTVRARAEPPVRPPPGSACATTSSGSAPATTTTRRSRTRPAPATATCSSGSRGSGPKAGARDSSSRRTARPSASRRGGHSPFRRARGSRRPLPSTSSPAARRAPYSARYAWRRVAGTGPCPSASPIDRIPAPCSPPPPRSSVRRAATPRSPPVSG